MTATAAPARDAPGQRWCQEWHATKVRGVRLGHAVGGEDHQMRWGSKRVAGAQVPVT